MQDEPETLTLVLVFVIIAKANMLKNKKSGERKRKYEARVEIGKTPEDCK
jgi:hypothetical protein